MRSVEDLIVYQKAMVMVTKVYAITKQFPKEERFGLVNQLRRAAVSVPSNIAEGAGRNSNNEFRRFLSIARGSTYEVKTQLQISQNLSFASKDELFGFLELLTEIEKITFKLIQHKK